MNVNRVPVMMKRVLSGLLLTALLSGCMEGIGGSGGTTPGTNAHASPRVQVMSGALTIAGPRGFCIDPGATHGAAGEAFVVLGSCAVISGNPHDAKPRKPALLTASVTASGAPLDDGALDRLARFITSDPGRDALARSDQAKTVRVLDITRAPGLLVIHASDGTAIGDLSGDYWRGIFEIAGQLVSVTVSGYRAAPLDERTGARLARDFVDAIRRANPGTQKGTTVPLGDAGNKLTSFLNRLL